MLSILKISNNCWNKCEYDLYYVSNAHMLNICKKRRIDKNIKSMQYSRVSIAYIENSNIWNICWSYAKCDIIVNDHEIMCDVNFDSQMTICLFKFNIFSTYVKLSNFVVTFVTFISMSINDTRSHNDIC